MPVARDLRRLPPDDFEAVNPWRALPKDQAPIAKRRSAGSAGAGLDKAQVDAPISREPRMRDDVAQAALARVLDRRNARDLLLPASGAVEQPELPALLRHQRSTGQRQTAPGQERQRPRAIERCDLGHSERSPTPFLRCRFTRSGATGGEGGNGGERH